MKTLTFALLAFCTSRLVSAAEPPAVIVERVLGAAHGVLSPLSGPEVAQALDVVRQNPSAYVPLLTDALTPERISSSEETELRAKNGAYALANAGGEAGRQSLASSFQSIVTKIDASEAALQSAGKKAKRPNAPALIAQRQAIDRLVHAQAAILSALGLVKDARLRDVVLGRIEHDDYSSQLRSLQYLEQTSKGDPQVKERLKPLLKDPSSPIAKNPLLHTLTQ
jgi:hypothetical protein